MRTIPIVFLILLLLLGGLGWVLLGPGEEGGAKVAQLEREAELPEEDSRPANMAAPKPSERTTVEVSEEAKAKALLDVRAAPEEEEPAFGALSVIVTDEAGQLLPGVIAVRYYKGPGHQFLSTQGYHQETDALGRARFTELVVGPHEFTLRHTSWDDAFFARRLMIELNSEMDEQGFVARTIREDVETELRLVFPNLHALAGTVLDRGAPLEGAAVRLYLDSESALDADGYLGGILSSPKRPSRLISKTSTEGKFRFEMLTQGRYALSVERPSGGMRQIWDLTLPDRSASVELQLDELSVHGVVTDSEGLPVAGAQLAVERVRVDEDGAPRSVDQVIGGEALHRAGMSAFVESGADGSYRIFDVDGSSPLIVVARSPYRVITRSEVFGFAEDESEKEINITLSPSGSVAVQLYAPSNLVPFMRLIATPLDHEGPSIIGYPNNGSERLRLTGLRPGRYFVGLGFFQDPLSSIALSGPAGTIPPDGPLAEVEPIETEVVAGETNELSMTYP